MSAIKLAPSILSADFAHLAHHVEQAESAGADRIHVDVMDGHFVPNISIGPPVVRSLRPVTKLPLECHLMIDEPQRYAKAFVEAGADSLLVHVENESDLRTTVEQVKTLGKKVGVVINPPTSTEMLPSILPEVDLVLVMTVNPGFGGQKFIEETLPKIREVRAMIDRIKPSVELEVDGGIDAETAPRAVEAGATVLVAGSAIFKAEAGVAAAMRSLRA